MTTIVSPSGAADSAVDRYGVFEAAFTAAAAPANPYRDIEATAELRRPTDATGAATWRIPLFWDGDREWRLRVSPDAAGEWSYVVTSNDAGLDGARGKFVCRESSRPGSIVPMPGAPLHFARQNGAPFWFLGDTAWALYTDSAAEKHDRAAALRYVDARAAQGFTVLHSMLMNEAGWGNNGGAPFDDIAAERINPAYWREVDLRLAHANSKGVVCGLALAWGNKRNVEPYAWGRFASLDARKRYARYVAARYSAYDVYFIVSGEWHAEVRRRPGATEDSIRDEFIAIGDALRAADPHGRMMAIHPMTSGGSVREYNRAAWMSFGDYQQNYQELHARVLQSREFGKPVVNSEYGYYLRDSDGDGRPDKSNSMSADSMRHATWDIVMAGGYAVTGFGTTYMGGNRDPGPFNLDDARNRVWEEQCARVKTIFAALEWWKLAPHDEWVACAAPRGKDERSDLEISGAGGGRGLLRPPAQTYWLLAEPGRQYVLYVRGLKQPVELTLDAPRLAAWQWNLRTGESAALDEPIDGNRFRYTPPDEQDWVVVIR